MNFVAFLGGGVRDTSTNRPLLQRWSHLATLDHHNSHQCTWQCFGQCSLRVGIWTRCPPTTRCPPVYTTHSRAVADAGLGLAWVWRDNQSGFFLAAQRESAQPRTAKDSNLATRSRTIENQPKHVTNQYQPAYFEQSILGYPRAWQSGHDDSWQSRIANRQCC